MNRSKQTKIKIIEIKLDGALKPCQRVTPAGYCCRCTEPSNRFFKDKVSNCYREPCMFHLATYLNSDWEELK
jgi:hypothetical protein